MNVLEALHRRVWRLTAPPRGADLLWSQGIAVHCDFGGPEGYASAPTESCQPEAFFAEHYRGARGLVWVRLSALARKGRPCDLDHFVTAALPTIRKPFALVTTDGDVSVPSQIRPETVAALLDSPYLVAWRSQNYDGTPHQKLGPFPIGLDLHTPRPEGGPDALSALLARLRRERTPAARQPLGVFCDVNLNLNSDERRRAMGALQGAPLLHVLGARVPQAEVWRRYASHPFVLSVAGHGVDCHRTWEALYLGAIVIARHSALDPLFEGLPVALVDDWDQARDTRQLAAWRDRYAPLTGRRRVWRKLAVEAWLRPLREAVAAAATAAKGRRGGAGAKARARQGGGPTRRRLT